MIPGIRPNAEFLRNVVLLLPPGPPNPPVAAPNTVGWAKPRTGIPFLYSFPTSKLKSRPTSVIDDGLNVNKEEEKEEGKERGMRSNCLIFNSRVDFVMYIMASEKGKRKQKCNTGRCAVENERT